MNFPFNIYLIAFAASTATAGIAVPFWRHWCHTTGLLDAPGHRKIHARPVALAGGLAIMTAMVLPVLGGAAVVGVGWSERQSLELLRYGYAHRAGQLAVIFGGAVGMLLLGWWDDRRDLHPGLKFAGQAVIAALTAASGIRATVFVDNLGFSYAVTILWLLTVVNAFNFMDNMNGLSAGIGLIAGLAFAVMSAFAGQYLVTSLALLMAGALLGFLPFNYPRASVFLGDSGSHLVGFLLGVLGILTTFYGEDAGERSRWVVILGPILILIVPLVDLVWVVTWRWRHGTPIYVGDRNHLSHRLVRRGWTEPATVGVLWICGVAGAAAAFLI